MDWIGTVEREGHALSTAARHDFHAEVPSCPGWVVNDLLSHVAVIHHRVAELVLTASTDPPVSPEPPSGNLLGWYEAGLAALLDAFRATDPATPVWTWADDKSVGFWLRRMSHETLIHRVDAELATGAVGPVDTELAIDGIDEALHMFARRGLAGDGETVHLHATDAQGEWLVTLGPEPRIELGHAKGDLAVRGPAAELDLWLWGRRPIDGLEVFGDAGLADRFQAP